MPNDILALHFICGFSYASPTNRPPIQSKDLTEKLNIISEQSFLSPDEPPPDEPKAEKSQVGARVALAFKLGRIVPDGGRVVGKPIVVGPALEAGDGVLHEAMGKQL